MIRDRLQAFLAAFDGRHEAVDVLAHSGGAKHSREKAAEAAGGMAVVVRVDQDLERDLGMPEKGLGDALGSAAAGEQNDVDLRPRRLLGRAAGIYGNRSIN